MDTRAAHVLARLAAAPLLPVPFPAIYVTEAMPREAYDGILRDQPREGGVQPAGYPARRIFDFPVPWMLTRGFMERVLRSLGFEMADLLHTLRADTRFVRDGEGYAIGPHTDGWNKVVSLLFYLPRDESDRDLGTSVYEPLQPGFICNGETHHPFDRFRRVWTAPFVPNSMFGFVRTGNSFHGVERVARPVERNVLLYNIFRK